MLSNYFLQSYKSYHEYANDDFDKDSWGWNSSGYSCSFVQLKKKKNERKKWTCNLMAHPVNLRSFFFSLKMVFKKWCNAWCHWFEFEEKAWQVVRLLLSHFCCCCCRCCLDLEFEPFTWLERFVDFALFTKKVCCRMIFALLTHTQIYEIVTHVVSL